MYREWDEPVVERWREIACDFCDKAVRGPKSTVSFRNIRRCEFCEKHVCQDCAWCHQENYYARCPDAHEFTRSCPDCKPIADAVVDDVRRSLGRYERFDEAMKRAVAAARGEPTQGEDD